MASRSVCPHKVRFVKDDSSQRWVFHVGPWRRAVPWLVFGPFLVLAIALCLFDGSEGRATGAFLLVIFGVTTLGLHGIISAARLELGPDGVRLRQIAMNIATPWSNVAGVRVEARRQGFLTHEPVEGRGAKNLAALRGFGFYGQRMYDDVQRAAMAERRWIPIEAFAWHIRRGQLQSVVAHFAPEAMSLENGDRLFPPAPSAPRPSFRQWLWIVLAVGGALALGVATGIDDSPFVARVADTGWMLFALVFTFRSAISAINAIRARAHLLGVLFALGTLVGLLWCVIAWSSLLGTAT